MSVHLDNPSLGVCCTGGGWRVVCYKGSLLRASESHQVAGHELGVVVRYTGSPPPSSSAAQDVGVAGGNPLRRPRDPRHHHRHAEARQGGSPLATGTEEGAWHFVSCEATAFVSEAATNRERPT